MMIFSQNLSPRGRAFTLPFRT